MAQNDIVLVDSLIEKARGRLTLASDDSELFELFCFEQVLKGYEPSMDDLEAGWTDGGNDGGIDGFFIYVDQRAATPNAADWALRRNPSLEVHIISSRHSATFQQQPIDSLISSLGELLDLRLDRRNLAYPYNEYVHQQRDLFKSVFVALADRQPMLKVIISYCARGDTDTLPNNIKARAKILQDLLSKLFSNSICSVNFLGAGELLTLSRKTFDFTLRLPFTETPISREGKNFVSLCTLSGYFLAICDENGVLKRYLFESNVRDYLGDVQVNSDILNTLRRRDEQDQGDFWWLNNGVTILATGARIVAKELIIDNAQIVNGLQTTETLYNYFSKQADKQDQRAILIKIIIAVDHGMRARIIKATNYQNSIDLSYLRGLDNMQRNIEEFLVDRGWYYDRRRNFYLNQGKPVDRIISIPYLASAVRAIALGDPASSPRQRSKSLRDDMVYNSVFVNSWDLRVYQSCLEIVRAVDQAMHSRRSTWNTPPMALTHFIGFVYACDSLGKYPYQPEEVASLVGTLPTQETVQTIYSELAGASKEVPSRTARARGVLLQKGFIDDFVRRRLASR